MSAELPPELHEIEQLATALAGRAGVMLSDRFRNTAEVRFKDRRGLDPVTDADHAVEAMVREAVDARFPAHALLGEEGADSGPPDADYVWVVDPLDGTANFINGLPLFSSSIGVLYRSEPVAGAIWASTGRRLQAGVYHGARGSGLRFDGVPVPYEPLNVTQANRLSALPGGVIGVTGPRGRRFGVARTLGSIALELALTADGSFRYCVIGDGKIWDVAAGVALCLAAGAQVSAQPGGGGWRSLDRFVVESEGPPSVAALHDWREKIVAGDPAVVPELARELAREQGRSASLRRLVFGTGS